MESLSLQDFPNTEQICPVCNEPGKKGGGGISVYWNVDHSVILGKCHRCGGKDAVWRIWPEKENKTPKTSLTLERWLRQNGISGDGNNTVGIPVIITKYIRVDGKESKLDSFRWEYPCESIHWKAFPQALPDGTILKPQRWETGPNGRLSFWVWRNDKTEYSTDYSQGTAYFVEGEKEALILGYFGELAFGCPGANAGTDARMVWFFKFLETHSHIHTIRICFDADKAGSNGRKGIVDKLAGHGLKIEYLKWPDDTLKGYDLFDIYTKHGRSWMETLRAFEWINPFAEKALVPVIEDDRIVFGSGIQRYPWGYHREKVSEQGTSELSLTNCVLNIERRYYAEGKLQYYAVISNPQRKSNGFRLDASCFADPGNFRRSISSQGPFHGYELSIRDLAQISEYECTKEGILNVADLDGYGWWKQHKIYAFPEGAISDGKWIPADENGLISIGENHYSVTTDYRFFGGVTPSFSPESSNEELERDLYSASRFIIGKEEDFSGLLILGWFLACFYSDLFWSVEGEKLRADQSFPFLQVIGPKGSGKTETLSRFIRICGYRIAGGDEFSESTSNFFHKSLYANLNLPMWYDEVTAQGRIRAGVLKGAFNRIGAGKGTKTGTTGLPVRGSLVLTGEEVQDETLNRSIFIPMPAGSERRSRNQGAFDWLTENGASLSRVGFRIMMDRTANLDTANAAFLNHYSKWKDCLKPYFQGLDAGSRLTHNYAACLAGLSLLSCSVQAIEDFQKQNLGQLAEWFRRYVVVHKATIQDRDIIEDGLNRYLSEQDHFAILKVEEEKQVVIIPCQILNWLERLNGFPIKQFETGLTSCPYVTDRSKSTRFPIFEKGQTSTTVTQNRKTIWFDATHKKFPAFLKELAIRRINGQWDLRGSE
jgi:hypothetical protein